MQHMILGVPALDQSHEAMFEELARLAMAPDQDFAHWYPLLIVAMERDFREEEEMMEVLDLPSFRVHREQHARMLSGLHHTASSVMAGHVAPGRQAIRLLTQWMVFHIATMDKALAAALQARNHDALPHPSGAESENAIP
jgi:hemerythrin-like metal-binding protein